MRLRVCRAPAPMAALPTTLATEASRIHWRGWRRLCHCETMAARVQGFPSVLLLVNAAPAHTREVVHVRVDGRSSQMMAPQAVKMAHRCGAQHETSQTTYCCINST